MSKALAESFFLWELHREDAAEFFFESFFSYESGNWIYERNIKSAVTFLRIEPF